MKISYSWLNNYLNLDFPAKEIAVFLTDTGLEVEAINIVESVRGSLEGVVIGEVISKVQHPNADRLNVTMVNIGGNNLLQIVCGAPNVSVGQKVPVATVGTWLYDGENKFKIKKGKIRGEESLGMICGEDELGLGKDTDGIMVLDATAKVGMNASEYFQLESDTVFDIGLTPNRSDAMGHIGVARDLLAVLNLKGKKLQMCKPSVEAFKVDNTSKVIDVEVKDSRLCPRYSGVSISGVKVVDSPNWLQIKLKSIGITPTNNVVDITNYVLHETGQPLHAFDLSAIKGNKIIVSTVKNKTKFSTLDKKDIELHSDDLVINNSNEPMCIAGVFGGFISGVSNLTTDIFLESAYFNPVSIRKTSKRHNLNTDASFRYERGCDPNITVYALKRAALLISEICGGKVSSDIIDIYPNPISHFNIELTYLKMDSLIGEEIDRDIVKGILNDLDIEIIKSTEIGLSLLVPPYRADVQREVDVIEEVLRIYGFNAIKVPSNLITNLSSSPDVNPEKIRELVSDLLSSNGFNETINNSIIKGEHTNLISELDITQNINILNPLSIDLNAMRQSLLFSGLDNIAYNQNRKNTNIKFYEFGKTYHKTDDGNIENQHLQILVSGRMKSENWNSNNKEVDFYYVKEKVEHILYRLGIKKFKSKTGSTWGRSYSLSYSFKNKNLVCFGKLTNDLCNKFGIKSDVYMANFNWDLILELSGFNKPKYKEVSKFPEVRRDLSLLIDKFISFHALKSIALNTDNKILKSVNLFDVYEGKNISIDKKSYSIRFILADKTRTLEDKEVDKVMERLIRNFNEKVGAELR